MQPTTTIPLKDTTLYTLSHTHNVAQFFSVGPSTRTSCKYHVRHVCIKGVDKKELYTLEDLVDFLLQTSINHTVSLRTFKSTAMSGNPFILGMNDKYIIMQSIYQYLDLGYYVIVNEFVPTHDGAISGVMIDSVVTFAPDVTPRFVEKHADTESLYPLSMATTIVKMFYHDTDITTLIMPHEEGMTHRIEFSVSPIPIGYRESRLVVWEYTDIALDSVKSITPRLTWPNRFSKMIGDKTYGLLIASLLNVRVPLTQVCFKTDALSFPVFGEHIERYDCGRYKDHMYLRTAPDVPHPGEYGSTIWRQPHLDDVRRYMKCEDPSGEVISSVLCQEVLDATYSGATMISLDASRCPDAAPRVVTSCVPGGGEAHMLGDSTVEMCITPNYIVKELIDITLSLSSIVESATFKYEWVYANDKLYVVQLQCISSPISQSVIYPGDMTNAIVYKTTRGLSELRRIVTCMRKTNEITPIILEGNVSIASHLGDLLRMAKIPSILRRPPIEE